MAWPALKFSYWGMFDGGFDDCDDGGMMTRASLHLVVSKTTGRRRTAGGRTDWSAAVFYSFGSCDTGDAFP